MGGYAKTPSLPSIPQPCTCTHTHTHTLQALTPCCTFSVDGGPLILKALVQGPSCRLGSGASSYSIQGKARVRVSMSACMYTCRRVRAYLCAHTSTPSMHVA